MNINNEQQVNDILNSMKGSERAKPRADLFDAIQNKVQKSTVKIVPMYQLRAAAAVGLLVLTLNIYAFRSVFLNETSGGNELVMDDNEESLISNYQIYE